ncbi:Crp/Fnr family transcriptional regulator [Lewinella sp. JB7]|uniref:Crp/Fnr family transcriptional regulator n=1 Tax=Lewinella sp. JB7 TaxID=2962887 RepID=UPI0020C9C745|nr:Crp/Fnr family transcriptional regulator [Lewinella sp. JB7]MCP9234898.1 Crp/Fnr family transcriptional regulator [Lewinella sp. JB7]
MNSEVFRPIIEKLVRVGVDPALADCFAHQLHQRRCRSKDVLFAEGDALPDAFYLLSGYVRLYATDENGNTIEKILAGPRDFVGCVSAILYQRPSELTAECITDCQLVVIDQHHQAVVKSDLKTFTFLQDIAIRHLITLINEKSAMLPLKARDRYLYFRERHPLFSAHIPAGIIANYIGVAPQSLSRIKQSMK